MISASQLNRLLSKYKQLFPGCVFDSDRLADFLNSEIFEITKSEDRPIGTILEAALVVLHQRMQEQKQDVRLSVGAGGIVTAEGFGCRGFDRGDGNQLADAILQLTNKVQ